MGSPLAAAPARRLRLLSSRLPVLIPVPASHEPDHVRSTLPRLFHANHAHCTASPMDPPMLARLRRLDQLVEGDLATLPEMPASSVSDDSVGGGVDLETVKSKFQAVHVSEKLVDTKSGPARTVKATPASPFTAPSTGHPAPNTTNGSHEQYLARHHGTPTTPFGCSPSTMKLAPPNLTIGQPAPVNSYFMPIAALSKFPYKYCNTSNSQLIAGAFFDHGKFWQREWDLYYVWDIDGASVKPLILVREDQANQLLAEVNKKLGLNVKITDQQCEEGFLGAFPDHPRCSPRYLGRTDTRDKYDNMVANTPAAPNVTPPNERTLEQFKRIMEDMWDAQKNKTKAAREKRKQDRLKKQVVMGQQFKRVQQYLGLRPSDPQELAAVDPSRPVPFPLEEDVVFVCVDVESYEKDHGKITEIGIASLDTRDLKGVHPGADGENWRAKIQARHIRINEFRHLVNHEFVRGAPDRFEFGDSEFVYLNDARHAIATLFKPPFCRKVSKEDVLATLGNLGQDRKIILLGHDTQSDVTYLQKLGYDPLKHVAELQDTALLYRVWRREPQITNLGKILYDFNIAGWNLHNAGNDAVYTVQAMLGICVREATIRGSEQLKAARETQKTSRMAELTEDAQKKAQDEAEGWSEDGP